MILKTRAPYCLTDTTAKDEEVIVCKYDEGKIVMILDGIAEKMKVGEDIEKYARELVIRYIIRRKMKKELRKHLGYLPHSILESI